MAINKKQDMQRHKLAVLTHLLIEEVNTIDGVLSANATDLLEKAKAFELALEPMLESVYSNKKISKTTYLNELANKVDTAVRKGYVDLNNIN